MRKQIREIKIIDLITYAIIPAILIVLVWTIGLSSLPKLLKYELVWWVYVIYGVVTYFLTKRLAIGLVLFYKAFAPLSVRSECRFEPTCSTYMIMAIQKYGLIIGVIKGIKRLLRCRPPNGGIDYP
ncbi:MAG: membrane protein insertion efficiency factor YidD [Clostridia bacterium]|nr:membrane protein insertion efficiency factor YidD [Clostridia bacterium]